MELRTILNSVCKLPGFVYGRIQLIEGESESEGSQWLLLKRPERLAENQEPTLAELGGAEPADGADVPAQGGLPAIAGELLPDPGVEVSQPLVPVRDALETGTAAEGREDAEEAQAAGAQLVPNRPDEFVSGGGTTE